MQSMNYFSHISHSNRFPENSQLGQLSLLDHVWTNFLPPSLSSISDHLPAFNNVIKQSAPDSKHKIILRDFSNYNHDKCTHELHQIKWEDLYHTTNTNEGFSALINTTDKLRNKCCPIKSEFVKYKRLQSPWLTRGLLISIKYQFINFKLSKLGIISHDTYKICMNNLTQVIRLAKCN